MLGSQPMSCTPSSPMLDSNFRYYVNLLFVDYSSAFIAIFPHRQFTQLKNLGLNSQLCRWLLDFLTGRPQLVRVGSCVSNTITLSTRAPQECV